MYYSVCSLQVRYHQVFCCVFLEWSAIANIPSKVSMLVHRPLQLLPSRFARHVAMISIHHQTSSNTKLM